MLLLASLLLFTQAHASPVKPESTEGRRIVHRLAAHATNAYVAETEQLRKKELQNKDSRFGCESARRQLLQDLSRLDLSRSEDLFAAKLTLEKSACPADGASADDLRRAHTSLFAATVYLRSVDTL